MSDIPEITVMPTAAAEAADGLVCMPVGVGHTPIIPSRQENCSECNRLVWVGLSAPASPPRVCMFCAKAKGWLDPGFEMKLSEIQAKEVLGLLKGK